MKKSAKIMTTGILMSLVMLTGCGTAQESSVIPNGQPTVTVTVALQETKKPTEESVTEPTATPEPIATQAPTPTETPTLTSEPTRMPTETPVSTVTPTLEPTVTLTPSPEPTVTPTAMPTSTPTATPTLEPTVTPTSAPTEPPHEHTYKESITKKVTCTEAGEKIFTCDCGDTYTEQVEATGHNYGTYTYNNDATTEKDGTETAICSACGDKTTRTKAGTKIVYDGYDDYGNGYIIGSDGYKYFNCNCPYPLYVLNDNGSDYLWWYSIGYDVSSGLSQQALSILRERYPDSTFTGGPKQGPCEGIYLDGTLFLYEAYPIDYDWSNFDWSSIS